MATHHPEHIIDGNGIEICTDAFGDPNDPCILLVMGAGASMLRWEVGLCEQLADGGRFVIRYDNRDTGRTTSCPLGEQNYTLADMAADGVAVLDAYGIERAHIAGASMGGMITQLIGLNHPDRVLTLTPIMSTPDPGRRWRHRTRSRAANIASRCLRPRRRSWQRSARWLGSTGPTARR